MSNFPYNSTVIHSPGEPVRTKGFSFAQGLPSYGFEGADVLRGSSASSSPSGSSSHLDIDAFVKDALSNIFANAFSLPDDSLIDIPGWPDLPDALRNPKTFDPRDLVMFLVPDYGLDRPLSYSEYSKLLTHPGYKEAIDNAVSGRWSEARRSWSSRGADESDLSDFKDAARETGVYPVNRANLDDDDEENDVDWNSGDTDYIVVPDQEWGEKNGVFPPSNPSSKSSQPSSNLPQPDLSFNVFRRLAPYLFDRGKKKFKDFLSPKPPTFRV